jgi:UDP-N-acetylglucosamine--N-acetylmuramyl-(pentapeptide) pyrophosphoryl-undecaprenol N-acetylglucosamine transferase
MNEVRLLIAGGGTGGHLFPGMAVAEEFLARGPEMKVLFMGTAAGLEARLCPAAGYPFAAIRARGIAGKGLGAKLRAAALIPFGIAGAWRIIRRFRPQAALGVGGYVSGPAIIAAWLLRVPAAVQEQNAVPGFTNRLLGLVARRVFVSFEATRAYFTRADRKGRVVVAGNPVRRPLVAALIGGARTPAERFRLFVTGGSLGAHALNELVPEAVARLAPAVRARLSVRHQTGAADREAVARRYDELGIEARVEDFIADMAAAYLAADLVVSRSGAGAVAEIALAGVPSILVPFPFAASDHQTMNARALAEAGAAIVLRQADTDAAALAAAIAAVAEDPEKRERMAAAARTVARPEAAATVVDHCLQLAGRGGES